MKKNIFSRLIAMVLIVMSVMAIALPALAATGQTNTKAVNIRTGPGTSYSVVGQVAKGTTFTVDSEVTGSTLNGSNVWLKISNIKCAAGSKNNIDGKPGYVHSSYVSGYQVGGGGSGSGTSTPTGAYINTNAVNIRDAASTSAKLLGQVAKNTTLTVHYETTGTTLNNSNVWLNVTIIKCASGSKHNIDGIVGFVHSSFVTGYKVTGNTGGGSGTPSDTGSLTNGYISGSNVNVRKLPGTSHASIGQYTNTPVLYYTGLHSADGRNWYHIIKPVDGYVASDYITNGGNIGHSVSGQPYCAQCLKALTPYNVISFTYNQFEGHTTMMNGALRSWYPATARYSYSCTQHPVSGIIDGPAISGYVWSDNTQNFIRGVGPS